MTSELMRHLLLAESSVESGYVKKSIRESSDSSEERRTLLNKADLAHDGLEIWKSIIQWVEA